MISFLLIISAFFQLKINASSNKKLILNQKASDIYTTKCDKFSYFQVEMVDPCEDLSISLHPTSGNPSIYVSKTKENPSLYDLTWTETDSYNLTISHWDADSSPGVYYIGIYGGCEVKSEPSVYKIFANSVDSSDADIYLNNTLTFNKYISASDYLFYKFCLPKCANVTVTLQNCLDHTICNDTYSYPELLVSRTEEFPRLYDYAFKLASSTRRSIFISHNDPAARDPNNFNTGSYFVGVYGWCTPDDQVISWDYDGPCSYAAKTLFNVTVEFHYSSDASSCDSLLYEELPAGTKEIVSGVTTNGFVSCSEYVYFKINVPNACSSLNIFVGNSTFESSIPELAVSQWPNLRPTFNNIQYTSYDWGYQNLTIDTFDPNFFGGNRCGLNKNELCYTIIGVTGYCADPSNTDPVHYSLTATIKPAHKIYGTLQSNQQVAAHSEHSYEFCIPEDDTTVTGATDTVAELMQYTSSCECSDKNTRLEMTISPRKPRAAVNELTWTISHYERISAIKLFGDNNDTRSGSYYLTVYGWCDDNTTASVCSASCSCAPCSHLKQNTYALKVSDDISYDYAEDVQEYLGYCDSNDNDNGSSNSSSLSPGAIAGIVIGCTVAILLLSGGIYYYYHSKENKMFYSSAESELESDAGSTSELVNVSKSV